ncbi:MAG TPA: LamG-like jellyroll fold domain-containing protein [Solirubrobacteraceae bacterium]
MRPAHREARPALALAVAVVLALPATSAAAGQVSLRPAAGAPGSRLTLKGSGFQAHKRVTIAAAGRRARTARASRHGTFTVTLTVPARTGWLRIVSRRGPRRVVNRFHVVPSGGGSDVAELASSRGPRVRFSPLTVRAGGFVRIRGRGYRGRVRLRITAFGHRRTVRTTRRGRISVDVKVPAAQAPGARRIQLRGGRVRFRVRVRVLASAPPATAGPASLTLPRITGAARAGAVLTASAGTWRATAPLEYAYAWQRCTPDGTRCAAISGATAPSYNVLDGDRGYRLRVLVTASNAAGSATAASPPTAVATSMPGVAKAPTLPTVARQGQTITVTSAVFTGSGPRKVATQWQRCGNTCADIGGDETSYKPWSADVGYRLQVVQTATGAGGTIQVTSNKTDPVQPAAAKTGVVALWHMNDSGSTMTDSAGHHNGTLHAVSTGLAGFSGTAFGFNGTSSYVTVPQAGDLSAVDQNVTLTIHMKTPVLPPSTVDDWDVIRSAGGYYDGDEYKMEYAPDGTAHCSFKGSGGYLEVVSSPSKPLADGNWHTIQCVKTKTAVETVVDGTVYSHRVTIGTIDITRGMIVGAHSNTAGVGTSEFYDGALDEASLVFSPAA